jgi:hypothetical protein
VDPFREGRTRGYQLACLFAYAGHQYFGASANRRWSTRDLANPNKESSCALFFMDGSYLGDFNLMRGPTSDDFLRALIGTPNAGLGAIWSRTHTGSQSLQGLALGDTLGETWWSTLAHHNLRDGLDARLGDVHTSLLGDPTLRMNPLSPVSGLQASTRGRGVELKWRAGKYRDMRYFVYRSPEGSSEPPVLLTKQPIRSRAFVDQKPLRGKSFYIVRPTRLRTGGCGSYHDVGPGVLARVAR